MLRQLYTNTDSQLARYAANLKPGLKKQRLDWVASIPTASWHGPDQAWDPDAAHLAAYISRAAAAKSLGIVVLYGIPYRDAGQYSAGGAATTSAYLAWIERVAGAINQNAAIVIYEPDALMQVDELPTDGQSERYDLMNQALALLKSECPNADIYVDAGHSNWLAADDVAKRLMRLAARNFLGISLNVSNFRPDDEITTYGESVLTTLNARDLRFIYDSSRNGNPIPPRSGFANPAGRKFGRPPYYTPNEPVGRCNGALWIKALGESDGDNATGVPPAGQLWVDYLWNDRCGEDVMPTSDDTEQVFHSSGMAQHNPITPLI